MMILGARREVQGARSSGPGLYDQYNVSYMDYIVERICLLWIGPSIPFV